MDRAVQKLLEIIFAFHFRSFRYFFAKDKSVWFKYLQRCTSLIYHYLKLR